MYDPNDTIGGVSRRSFLKGSGAAAAAASTLTIAAPTEVEAKAEEEALGPGAVSITLQVNGKEMKTSVEPRVTLLDALRDYLDVTGCKRVCDRGTCGACTVLLEGKPIYACSMLAVDSIGKKITTVEGLAPESQIHEVSQAFWNRDASQCGFCTPGFVVACAAVLAQNPKASVAEVKRGLDGNLCRCGTYEQMADAIADLTGGKS